MESSKRQLLELTRCGLHDAELNLRCFEGGVDWAEVIRLAKQQTLVGVVLSAIERLPAELRPRRDMILRLHQMTTLNRQARAQHVEALGGLIELLRCGGVEQPVLLKGLGVGLNYPDPTLRMCGDIDMYIGTKNFDRCCDYLVQEIGLVRDAESECGHHIHFDYLGANIELHKYPTAPSDMSYHRAEFLEWCESQLEGDDIRRVIIDGVSVNLPPYNFDFIFIFYHMWKHLLMGGVGFRQLCDWCCYIDRHSEAFDRVELARLSSRFGMNGAISLFATIGVEELGLNAERVPNFKQADRAKCDRVLDKIWSGGNFGAYRDDRSGRSRNVLERKFNILLTMLRDVPSMFMIEPAYSLKFYSTMIFNRVIASFGDLKHLFSRL